MTKMMKDWLNDFLCYSAAGNSCSGPAVARELNHYSLSFMLLPVPVFPMLSNSVSFNIASSTLWAKWCNLLLMTFHRHKNYRPINIFPHLICPQHLTFILSFAIFIALSCLFIPSHINGHIVLFVRA